MNLTLFPTDKGFAFDGEAGHDGLITDDLFDKLKGAIQKQVFAGLMSGGGGDDEGGEAKGLIGIMKSNFKKFGTTDASKFKDMGSTDWGKLSGQYSESEREQIDKLVEEKKGQPGPLDGGDSLAEIP